MTERQMQIINAYERLGNKSEVARLLGVSKEYIRKVVNDGVSKDGSPYPVYYKDKGCPDGAYPTCLGCPLVKCREEPKRSTAL